MIRFLAYILSFTIIILLLEISSRTLLSNNLPFEERFRMNLKYIDSPNGTTLSPNQIIYHTSQGMVVKDSIKYKINSFGQRGDSYELEKTTDEIRIVFMGGSHIFDLNYYYYDGGSFTRDLMQKFNNQLINVINTGVPGYTMKNIATRIEQDIINYNPDIVIINSIWNDIKVITKFDTSKTIPLIKKEKSIDLPNKNPLSNKVNVYDSIFGRSSVYRKIRDYYWYNKLNIGSDKLVIESIINKDYLSSKVFDRSLISLGLIQHYQYNVLRSIELLKKNNIIPVIAIEERLIDYNNKIEEKRKIKYQMVGVNTHKELVDLFAQCDSLLIDIANNENIYLININKKIPSTLSYFTDHVHTTPLGSQFMANEYYNILQPLIDSLFAVN